jgi:hypothetical protein
VGRKFWVRQFIVLTCVLAALEARAGLGDFVDTSSTAALKTRALANDSDPTAYEIQQTTLGATQVREYFSPQHQVFGVAWSGLAHPPLEKLLGSYLPQFLRERGSPVHYPGRRSISGAHGSEVIVEKWGHMRNLQGRAYIRTLLPAGMDPHEIK